MADKQRVLILCTGNSARSQVAEGLLRARAGDRFEVVSAGSDPAGYVLPGAVTVMSEIGIDISAQMSKGMQQFFDDEFDYVLTVCDRAAEACPVFPGPGVRHHHDFPDPARVPEADRLDVFRQVRDAIDAWLKQIFEY